MTTNIEKIIDKFPHAKLPTHKGLPTYAVLAELQLQLNDNAASVPCNLGNGALGHLALTMGKEEHDELSNVEFIVPTNPGTEPIYPEGGGTQHTIAAAERTFQTRLSVWRIYMATDTALKQQLLCALNPIYYKKIRHPKTDYSGVTTRQLLQHLYKMYGTITPADLAINDASLKEPIDLDQPMEVFYDRVDIAIELAAAGKTSYTQPQLIAICYHNIFKTGLLEPACKDWRELPTDENNTWELFKVFFEKAHTECKASTGTTKAAGFHTANVVQLDDETRSMLANMATEDNATIVNLQSANSELQNKFDEQNKLLMALSAKISTLDSHSNSNSGHEHSKRTHHQHSSNNNKRYKGDNNYSRQPARFANTNYCWTHGYRIADSHTSATCHARADGHQAEATRQNTMGGSSANKYNRT